MSRQLKCIRAIRFWGKDFEVGKTYDIDAFAASRNKDALWMFTKMDRPMVQSGRKMVRCFAEVGAPGGGSAPAEAPPEPAPEPVEEPQPEPEADGGAEEAEQDEEPYEPEHVGGGYYELSNGERVKGRPEAHEAQQKLGSDDNAQAED
jgi:hypothetical protein